MRQSPSRPGGFTLIELLTVIVIITILLLMLTPLIGLYRAHAEKIECMSNLHTLYVTANSYIQQNGYWPQISTSLSKQKYDAAWIAAFQPFGLANVNWVCPTIQRELNNPNLNGPNAARSDYAATPFGANRNTPFRWITQPWFVEKGNSHGNGNLLVFPDGSIDELNNVARRAGMSVNQNQ